MYNMEFAVFYNIQYESYEPVDAWHWTMWYTDIGIQFEPFRFDGKRFFSTNQMYVLQVLTMEWTTNWKAKINNEIKIDKRNWLFVSSVPDS